MLVFFFLQKDLGPALILAFLFLTLYCVARGKPWMALVGTALLAIAFAGGLQARLPGDGERPAQHVAVALGQLPSAAATTWRRGSGRWPAAR